MGLFGSILHNEEAGCSLTGYHFPPREKSWMVKVFCNWTVALLGKRETGKVKLFLPFSVCPNLDCFALKVFWIFLLDLQISTLVSGWLPKLVFLREGEKEDDRKHQLCHHFPEADNYYSKSSSLLEHITRLSSPGSLKVRFGHLAKWLKGSSTRNSV